MGLARTLQRGSSRKWGDFQREVVRKWGQSYGLLQNYLCPCQDLTLKTQLEAVNGKKMPALEVFAHALRFFKEHALQVCCGPIPAHWAGTPPRAIVSSQPVRQGSEITLLQPLPSHLREPAWDIQVLGREVFGILPTQLGSPSRGLISSSSSHT